MATLYWYSDNIDPSWTLITGNWWADSDHTIGVDNIPTAEDQVILLGGVVPRIALDHLLWVCPASIDGTALNPDEAASGPIFSSDSTPISLACSVLGNATFLSQAVNGMLVGGKAYFTIQSSNAGSVGEASFTGESTNGVSGQVSGDATFTDQAINNGAVIGNATFHVSGRHNGTVGGNADFYDDGACYGTVTGQAAFYTNTINYSNSLYGPSFTNASRNDGSFENASFSGTSSNTGSVSGDSWFSEDAHNEGTVAAATFAGNTLNNATVTGNATFTEYSQCCGPVTGVATFTDNAANRRAGLDNPIFNGHSYNYESVNGATFSDTADNSGAVIGSAVFNGSSVNNSSVSGSAEFHDSTSNNSVVGSATFDGTSSNNNEVIGDATFASGTINNGNVGGQATFADGTTNAGQVMGSAEFHGTSINTGSLSGNGVFWDTSTNSGGIGGTAQLMWATGQTAILSGSTWGSAAHVVDADGAEILHWQFIHGASLVGRLTISDNGSLLVDSESTILNGGFVVAGLKSIIDNQSTSDLIVTVYAVIAPSSTMAAVVDYPAVGDVKAGVPFANGKEGTLPDGGGGGGVNRPNRSGGLWF